MLAACERDPSPKGLVQPEILDVIATVLEDGRVSFSCTVNDTRAITECGFVFSAGDLQEVSLKGEIPDDHHFRALSEVLTSAGRYSYSAFVGNGRTVLERFGGHFDIAPCSSQDPDIPDNPDDPDLPETPPTPPEGPKSMLLKVDSGSNGRVFLPFQGAVDVSVDWGDGTLEAFRGTYSEGEWVSHKYAPDGEYYVCIEGVVESMTTCYDYSMPYPEKIQAILRWGNLEATSYLAALKYCINLSEIAADTLGAFRNAPVSAIFMGCTSLKTVPDSLFAWHAGDDLSGLFLGCKALESIPAHIFAKCGQAKNFDYIFEDCSSLTAIPEGLFDDCPEVEGFQGAFSGCTGLTSVPVSLFDNNRKVRIFRDTFKMCGMVTSESPYTLVDSEKVHLYERAFSTEFATPVEFDNCFYYYTLFMSDPKWADYNNIPQSWK